MFFGLWWFDSVGKGEGFLGFVLVGVEVVLLGDFIGVGVVVVGDEVLVGFGCVKFRVLRYLFRLRLGIFGVLFWICWSYVWVRFKWFCRFWILRVGGGIGCLNWYVYFVR